MAEGPARLTEGMLSLSWNNHSAAFTQTLATLREKEIYTDVTLACEGKFYPVHKLVLSTCSDYFLQMFERTSCKHPIIILKDVQCREMEALLSYMYAGIVCVPQSDLAQLIMVAEALQIKGLAVPDETMCANKRLSHTWSPTDDRISPHAKRLRNDDNGTGVQYQRLSDGQTVFKPQTLTGVPSFAGIAPQTRGCSPTLSSGSKHTQPSVRPTYTTVRYSPYPRDVERQHSSPRQIQRTDLQDTQGNFRTDQKQGTVASDTRKQNDLKLEKSSYPQSNGSEGATSHSDIQNSVDKEILPESLVKVEVEERDEAFHVEAPVVDHTQPCNSDCSRGQSHSRLDTSELSKADVVRSKEEIMEAADYIKEELNMDDTINSEENFDGSADTSTFSGGKEMSISQKSQIAKVESEIMAAPSSHHELGENIPPKMSMGNASSSWEDDDDDSSHPLDLSDGQKQQQAHQTVGSESDSPRVIRRLYEHRRSKFPCPYCSFQTTQKYQLNKHMRMHSAENPFSCPYCPFRAPLHVSLKEHLNTHKSVSESGR